MTVEPPVGVLVHLTGDRGAGEGGAGEGGADDATIVELVAAVQQMTGGFRPFFVTEGFELRAYRTAGYGVEVLPSRDQFERLGSLGDAERLRADRLRELTDSYEVEHVVTVARDDAATLVEVLRALG